MNSQIEARSGETERERTRFLREDFVESQIQNVNLNILVYVHMKMARRIFEMTRVNACYLAYAQ